MSEEQVRITVERICLQGKETLEVIQSNTESVRYRVLGLDGTVEIRDYRPAGLRALEAAYTQQGYEAFPSNFDSPALVTIHKDEQGTVVELRKPVDDYVATYDVLWVAAQVNDSLPVWPMAWHVESELPDGRHSFVAILE